MWTLPNAISLARLPMALLFLKVTAYWRGVILILALLSDGLDGLLARRCKQVTRVGTFLDPLTDKIFVMTALCLFMFQDKIDILHSAIFICRDFSVLLFGMYLVLTGNFAHYEFRSIWSGKISTVLQFVVLFGINSGYDLPDSIYSVFLLLGILALGELYFSDHKAGGYLFRS